ncbi:tautomerase family protein [Sodalis sp. dw_96]|uniref:tautomerase family protein n=1 Tax=Sodalis sp. dw_96 TaxID=2719794 RepID=UPI001BD38BD8|nr:tautomerase family protein [Sodalis sp. dw_96]
MPNVIISFLAGRDLNQKRDMVEKVTEALMSSLGCQRDSVHIVMHEITEEQTAHGGILRCDKK